jgi:hypothetical protein
MPLLDGGRSGRRNRVVQQLARVPTYVRSMYAI